MSSARSNPRSLTSSPTSPRLTSTTTNTHRRRESGIGAGRDRERKRISALRLSTDTTSSLPEYIAWQQHRERLGLPTLESEAEPPPDYPGPTPEPDSAAEGDEDTDASSDHTRQSSNPPTTPRRRSSATHPPRNRRRKPGSFSSSQAQFKTENEDSIDPYLDALLARSVQALEMSNTLLMQSNSASNTPLTTPAPYHDSFTSMPQPFPSSSSQRVRTWQGRGRDDRIDAEYDSFLDHNMGMKTRRMSGGGAREREGRWKHDLEDIWRDVDNLFPSTSASPTQDNNSYTYIPRHRKESTSSSLPQDSSMPTRESVTRRRPSLDLGRTPSLASTSTTVTSLSSGPSLRLEKQNRRQLVSPPPRALTQYVASDIYHGTSVEINDESDLEDITIPSTLGLRSAGSTFRASGWKAHQEQLKDNLLIKTAKAAGTEIPGLPAPSAFERLKGFVYRPAASMSASTLLPSSKWATTEPPNLGRGRGESATQSATSSPPISRRSRSHTPLPSTRSDIAQPTSSQITPILELPSSASSTSDSDHTDCRAKQTVSALRKILDATPPPPPPPRLLPPNLLSPPPLPVEAEPSSATASISRLFTKGTHMHSSSISSAAERKPSALRGTSSQASRVATPDSDAALSPRLGPTAGSRTPTSLSIPELLSAGVSLALAGVGVGNRSTSGSGTTTPNSTSAKRISFAQLPEAHHSSNAAAKFPTQGHKSKSKGSQRRGKQRHSRNESGDGLRMTRHDEEDYSGGWLGWLVGGPSSGLRHEERFEERMGPGRMGGGDWTF